MAVSVSVSVSSPINRGQKSSLLLLFILQILINGKGVLSQSPVFACDIGKNPDLGDYGFCNSSMEISERVEDLVKRLTLQEKIGFLVNKAGSVSRLGIPSYEWWSEALHGVSYVGPGTHFSSLVPGATSFPMVILTAATFNVSLFQAIGKLMSCSLNIQHSITLFIPNQRSHSRILESEKMHFKDM